MNFSENLDSVPPVWEGRIARRNADLLQGAELFPRTSVIVMVSAVNAPISTIELTVLVCVQNGKWFAQCVEYDIAAQAKSLDNVMYEFERTLNTQCAIDILHGRFPLSEVPPAPEKFRKIAASSWHVDAVRPRFLAPEVSNRVRLSSEVKICPDAEALCTV